MSAFRKTVLTTAIIGAGLASTSGAAFATECHDGGHGHEHGSHSKTVNNTTNNTCVNNAGGSVVNKHSKALGLVNGSQGAIQGNILCDAVKDNLNGNLSNNSTVINLGGESLPGFPV